MEYLGFWVTRDVTNPEIEIYKQQLIWSHLPPKKKVRKFIGVVSYYRNMWPRRSHTLVLLTRTTPNKRKFKWTKVEQDVFDKIKRIVARDTLLTYTDFNESFKSHINDSAFQLRAVISQKGKPIAFYSRKLTDPQQWNTLTEKELIRIVENIKEFRTILLGKNIIIYNDNKNLTCKDFNTNRVSRWRLILE